LVDFDEQDYENRGRIAKHEREYLWRTFRDYEAFDAAKIYSLLTGSKYVPLQARWIDLHDVEAWRRDFLTPECRGGSRGADLAPNVKCWIYWMRRTSGGHPPLYKECFKIADSKDMF
jgi:hypothetical protein